MVSMRKVAWLLKHGGVGQLALFKIDCGVGAFVRELRGAVEPRYREGGRLALFNFVGDIESRSNERRFARVPESWYTKTVV
jgi:hypothetical protein